MLPLSLCTWINRHQRCSQLAVMMCSIPNWPHNPSAKGREKRRMKGQRGRHRRRENRQHHRICHCFQVRKCEGTEGDSLRATDGGAPRLPSTCCRTAAPNAKPQIYMHSKSNWISLTDRLSEQLAWGRGRFTWFEDQSFSLCGQRSELN